MKVKLSTGIEVEESLARSVSPGEDPGGNLITLLLSVTVYMGG